ncbi:hypothetical protein D3C80_1428220 [compost metagenome]
MAQQRQDRPGQERQCIAFAGHDPQLFPQAEQCTAQALITARHALLQQVMGHPKNLMSAGELVQTRPAVVVGPLQALQALLPQIVHLPHQHAAQQQANNE